MSWKVIAALLLSAGLAREVVGQPTTCAIEGKVYKADGFTPAPNEIASFSPATPQTSGSGYIIIGPAVTAKTSSSGVWTKTLLAGGIFAVDIDQANIHGYIVVPSGAACTAAPNEPELPDDTSTPDAAGITLLRDAQPLKVHGQPNQCGNGDLDANCLVAGIGGVPLCVGASLADGQGWFLDGPNACLEPQTGGGGGGGGNVFVTIDASAGTDPVADSATDTLIAAGTAPIVVTGDSATDSLTWSCPTCSTGAHTTDTDDQTAPEVPYAPTTGTDWVDPDPADVAAALDDVAGRLTVEEAAAPLAHAASHQNGGADELSVAGLSGALADPQTPAAHGLVGATHTTSGETDGQVVQATGATTYDFGWVRLRSHATDCTALTDGVANEACLELDSDKLYTCQPSAGGCDTAGEWIALADGTGTDDQVASEVPFTPAGGIAATEVQAALEEVDAEHTVDTDTTCLDAGVACLFAASASEGGAATSGDSATDFFSSGTIEDARLSANVSLLGQTIVDAEFTPPGADTQVTFNDVGVLGADTGMTWNKTTNTLFVGSGFADGLIGIGVDSAPVKQLEVSSNSTGLERGIAISQHNDTASEGVLQFFKSRGTRSAKTAVADGDFTGTVVVRGWDGSAYQKSAQMFFGVSGAVSAGVVPMYIAWKTGSSDAAPERMRINSTGEVGIGKTATAGVELDVLGDGVFSGTLGASNLSGTNTGDNPGYAVVDDEDTPLTQRTTMNFEGAGVTCADDTDQTTCTIPGGAGGGDRIADLTSAEIAITGTDTATISRQHVCSGTTADYTVTLPAASGNAGKFISFRMAPGLTKLVTLDGNASETIDGALTRIMWAGESAELYCDGSAWSKMAGRSIPMSATMRLSAQQTGVLTGTPTKILLNVIDLDNTGRLGDTTNKRVNIIRPGEYAIRGIMMWDFAVGNMPRSIAMIYKNGSAIFQNEGYVEGGAFGGGMVATPYTTLAAGDFIEFWGLQNSGSTDEFYGVATGSSTTIAVQEIITW